MEAGYNKVCKYGEIICLAIFVHKNILTIKKDLQSRSLSYDKQLLPEQVTIKL